MRRPVLKKSAKRKEAKSAGARKGASRKSNPAASEMRDTPVLGQGSLSASSEAPSSSPAATASTSDLSSPIADLSPRPARRTRLSDSIYKALENSSPSEARSTGGEASQETSPNSSEPALGSNNSPLYSPPDSSKASSASEPDVVQSSGMVAAAAQQADQEAPCNLTGARKRKAHRVMKRETSSERVLPMVVDTPVVEPSSSEAGTEGEEESSVKYVCPVCDTIFERQHDFTVHIRSHNEASSSSSSSSNSTPLNLNNNKAFSCSICGKLLSSSSSLDRHMLVHSGERPFKCRICSVSFTTNGNMHRHMRTHNNNTSSVNNNHHQHGSMDSDSSDNEVAVKTRKRRSNGDASSIPSPKRSNSSASPPAASVPCPERCDKCFVTFDSERELNLHRYTAHGDEPSPVEDTKPQVGFKDLNFVDFSTEKFPLIAKAFCERSVHKASSVFQRFQCDECGRAFPCGSALTMHVTSVHAEAAPRDLTCPRRKLHYEEQKQDFFAGLDLQTKSPTSTPSPNIKVRSISELASVPVPPKVEEEAPSVKEEVIDLGKSPNSSDENLRQMKLRGEFPCRLCTAVFPNLRALKGHNRVHLVTGPPYLCNMCTYSSSDKATLVRHLRSHNGERPFECRLCHYAFTTKANCERHLRNRHNRTTRDEVRRSIICHSEGDVQPDKPHECAACERTFPTRVAALSHVACEHPTLSAADLVRLGADPEEIEDEQELLMSPGNSPRCQSRSSNEESPVAAPAPSKMVQAPLDLSMDALDLSKKPTVAAAAPPAPSAPVASSAPKLPPQEQPEDLTKSKEVPAALIPPYIPHPFLGHGLSGPPSQFFPPSFMSYFSSPFQRHPFPFLMPPHMFNNGQPGAPPQAPQLPPNSSFDEVKEQLQKELIRGLQLTSGGSLVMDALRKPLEAAAEPPRIASSPIRASPKPPTIEAPVKISEPGMKMVIKNGVLMPKQKQRRYRTERPFACEHCSARFTLRSNMERHVKQQHPQFWCQRPRGGRRSAPTSLTAMRRDPSPPAHSSSANENGNLGPDSRISDEVKLALAHQLKNKLNHNNEEDEDDEEEEEAFEGDGEYEEDEPELVIDEQQPKGGKDQPDRDLASVSRLLVNASVQSFQQYFPGQDEEEDEEEEGFMEGDDLDEGVLDDGSSSGEGQVTSGDEGRGGSRTSSTAPNSPGKKKSAYSTAPNRVTCPYCHRKFPWSSSLRRHILTHTGQKPYKCAHCPLLFTTKSNCDRHLLRKHSNKKTSNPSSPPSTPVPPPPAAAAAALPPPSDDGHLHLCRNVPERPFKCTMCPSSTFSTERNLRKHMSSKHNNKRASTSPPTTISSSTPPSSGKEARGSATDSGRGTTPDPLPPSSESSNSPPEALAAPATPASLTCYKCSQTFSSEARLTTHLESHSDLPFKCHLCENSYAERQEALEHIKLQHTPEYDLLVSKGALDHNAEDCTANAPPSNNNNVDAEDTLETLRGKFPDYANRKVMCAFCMRRFWSAEDLRRHMRTHTGERPFTCDICWRKFTLKHSMLRHRKKHAGVSGGGGPAASEAHSDDDNISTGSSNKESLRRWAEHGLAVYGGAASRVAASLASSRHEASDEADLIGNLLGIKDRAMIDHMLLSKSADDAAKLLGVSSQR